MLQALKRSKRAMQDLRNSEEFQKLDKTRTQILSCSPQKEHSPPYTLIIAQWRPMLDFWLPEVWGNHLTVDEGVGN